MAEKVQQQLKELGSMLDSPPASKEALLKLLKQAVTILADLDQSPSAPVLDSMQPFLKAIVKPELLKHQDKDIKLLVACCLCEITRITAPEAPYSDEILKDIFSLIVDSFGGLNDSTGPSFGRRVLMLEILARYRSCVVMLDLECDDLVIEMFRTFISIARDDHPDNVLTSMRSIMVVLLEESEDVHEDILVTLLSSLGRDKKDVSQAAKKLTMNVIEDCAEKLEPSIKQLLISSMSGDDESTSSQLDYHEVIFDLYRCCPQILSGIVPYLIGELLNDQTETRLRAVKLVGELFAITGQDIVEEFKPIFVEFLKRLTDRAVEVRMVVLEYVKRCLLSNPSRSEAPQIHAALCDRLLDYDENVRKQVVSVVCDVAFHDLRSVPIETMKLVAERLRDKSLLVKKYTMDRLADIFRLHCSRCTEGFVYEYNWIPGKIIRCFYDKDFRSDAVESMLSETIFPSEFSVKDKVKQWIRTFPGLDKVEVKALEKILEQKQRLQQEMQKYLSFKQTYKDIDVPDFQKKTTLFFRVMSRCFTDPVKAEEGFQNLDQLKDAKIWKTLLNLVDPDMNIDVARRNLDDMLKILGEKHQLFDFLSILSIKCSYMLFNKEYVKEILSEVATGKSSGDSQHTISCMNMLVILARYNPVLFSGSEEELLKLLKEEDDIVKEGILRVLAMAGGTIREQLASSSNSLDLILEKLCLEGSRRQAKYAVHALTAITKDDGLLSLSVLYKRLVDMLEDKTHLPSVLQSLGCIAQTAMAVFETRESEILEFIKSKILQCSSKTLGKKKTRWLDRSDLCLLKIYGIKLLVKSYSPVKDAHLRAGIDDIIEIFRNILLFGEVSKDVESSFVDKAHLRLAAAKAVLRLSRFWDHKMPADVFHLTLRAVEISFPQARKMFRSKVHQYLKDRILDAKYACTFLLSTLGSRQAEIEEDKRNLVDIIQMCCQLRARPTSMQSEANATMPYPEYILPYLVHVIAHHRLFPNVDECKDAKAFEPIYRILYLFLSMVLHGEDAGRERNATENEKESLSTLTSILQCIKRSEDVMDVAKSMNSYAICDLGLSIIKRLSQPSDPHQYAIPSVSLPPTLYKHREVEGDNNPEAGEVQTWLAVHSVVDHFNTLKLEVNGTVPSAADQDELLEDNEVDGNDLPLGKLIKHIKSQKVSSKKGADENSLPAAPKIPDDFDVLKVVREVNLSGLETPIKIDSINGHDSLAGDDETDDKRKRESSDSGSVPATKRHRSSSAKSPSNKSVPRNLKGAGGSHKKTLKEENETGNSELLVSCSRNKHKRSVSGQDNDERLSDEEVDATKRRNLGSQNQNKTADSVTSAGSMKKRKRRSVAGLSKSSLKEDEIHTTDLVDCRIKVWWPLDKAFYAGVVKSYDPEKKKHVVLYEDGDVEVLRLDKERWELIPEEDIKHNKKSKTSKQSPKRVSSDKKTKSLDGSTGKKSAERSSTAKRKRTKRNSEGKGKSISSGQTNSHEAEQKSDLSDPEATLTSEVDELDTGEKSDKVDDKGKGLVVKSDEKTDSEPAVGGEESEGYNDSKSSGDKEKSTKNVKGGSKDNISEDSDAGNSDSEEEKVDKLSGDSLQEQPKQVEQPDPADNNSSAVHNETVELTDADEDEPIAAWTRRVGKSSRGK